MADDLYHDQKCKAAISGHKTMEMLARYTTLRAEDFGQLEPELQRKVDQLKAKLWEVINRAKQLKKSKRKGPQHVRH